MKPDISNLSVAELKKLTDEAGALIESKKEQELDAAYDRITEIAASVGVTLDELETLLHELGHAVHNNLSQARHVQQAGTSVLRAKMA